MNIGNRLWISSEEASMKNETKPKAQMPVGKARHVANVPWLAGESCEGNVTMTKAIGILG